MIGVETSALISAEQMTAKETAKKMKKKADDLDKLTEQMQNWKVMV